MILRMDYDSVDAVPTIAKIKIRLERAGYKFMAYKKRPSPSGRGVHVTVVVKGEATTPFEVIALQAILGSDPVREAYNMVRAKNVKAVGPFWAERWNVLYNGSD